MASPNVGWEDSRTMDHRTHHTVTQAKSPSFLQRLQTGVQNAVSLALPRSTQQRAGETEFMQSQTDHENLEGDESIHEQLSDEARESTPKALLSRSLKRKRFEQRPDLYEVVAEEEEDRAGSHVNKHPRRVTRSSQAPLVAPKTSKGPTTVTTRNTKSRTAPASSLMPTPTAKKPTVKRGRKTTKVQVVLAASGNDENGEDGVNEGDAADGQQVADEEDEVDVRNVREEGSFSSSIQVSLNVIEELDLLCLETTRVGQRYHKDSNKWTTSEKPKIESTKQSIGLKRALRQLASNYTGFTEAKIARDEDAMNTARKKVTEFVDNIGNQTDNLLKILPQYNDTARTIFLQDLYFHVIPTFAEAIRAVTKTLSEEGSLDSFKTSELLELVKLLTTFLNLSSEALDQAKEIQPKPAKGFQYQIQNPIRRAKTKLRRLRATLLKEIKTRDDSEREKLRLENERQAQEEREYRFISEQEKRLQETEKQLQEAEKKRRGPEQQGPAKLREYKAKRHKLQWKAINLQLDEPYWGQLLRHDIIRSKVIADGQQESSTRHDRSEYILRRMVETYNHRVSEPEAELDPFDDNYSDLLESEPEPEPAPNTSPYKFGRNNVNYLPPALSERQKEIFIEVMRKEQGEDRYQKAAKILDYSIEEIFAFAKDLQEAMDGCHEKGLLNDPEDEWTYSIWTEQ